MAKEMKQLRLELAKAKKALVDEKLHEKAMIAKAVAKKAMPKTTASKKASPRSAETHNPGHHGSEKPQVRSNRGKWSEAG